MRGTPFDEQVQPQRIGPSWGRARSPRTFVQGPQGPHMEFPQVWMRGAKGCHVSEKADPSSEESARRGCCEDHEFRETGPVGQYGATNRTCSSSSLSLQSVCARRLTEGNAYLCRSWGQLCASASVPSVSSDRE